MSQPQNCVAVIPCYNESPGIRLLVHEVKRFVANVLVVDDGSRDGTAETARQAGAEVFIHSTRMGKGRSLVDGWRAARNAGYAWAITLDGDGQHSPKNIPRFLHKAEETGAPLVIGNRMSDPRGMPMVRRWVNRWLSRRISSLAGQPLADTQCGFRLVHLPTLEHVPIKAEHFEIESETVFQFAIRRLLVEYVPIDVIYATEMSKIRPLKDTVRWLQWHSRIRREMEALGAQNQGLETNNRTRVPCSIQAL